MEVLVINGDSRRDMGGVATYLQALDHWTR